MSLRLRQMYWLIALVILVVFPGTSHAAAGAVALSTFVKTKIIDQALTAFWGIALLAVFYYGFQTIFNSSNEQATTELSNAIFYALIGFAIIGSATVFSNGLSTTGLSTTTSTTAAVSGAGVLSHIATVRSFIVNLSASIFFLVIVISAFRMLNSPGDQGSYDKWRKVIVGDVIGAMILFIADAIVVSVSAGTPLALITEFRGIALFLLTVAGFMSGFGLVVAGIMLILSVEEGLQDRAKKIIFGTLISLIVVICLYAIIQTFVPETYIL